MNIERSVTLIGLCFALFFYGASDAQIQHGGDPLGDKVEAGRSDLPFLDMPAVDEEALMKEDSLARANGEKVLRFAKNHSVSIDPGSDGVWKDGSKGRAYWRVGIHSEGARSLSLALDPFDLSQGARLFIYTPDQRIVRGSFIQSNGGESNNLAIAPIPRDRIIVELVVPKAQKDENRLGITRVSHAYRDVLGLDDEKRDFGDAGACNMNVNCPDGQPWQDQKRAVGMIVANGSRLCSGALVNNTEQDGTPYFLTAEHCLGAGGSPSGWVFVFNYESSDCSDQNAATDQSISGATLRADNVDSDFGLLELDDTPPDAYEVFYAGWDHSGNTPDSTVSIHHPRGDIKKISFDDDAPSSAQYQNSIPNGEWQVHEWDRNTTTEVGSSGGPLFDQDGSLVGQLHGGEADCGNSVNDYFGKFSVSWDHDAATSDQLEYWLDPNDSNSTVLEGYDPLLGNYPNDVALTRILAPEGVTCTGEEFRAKVEFQNRGSSTLDSLDLYLILGTDTLEKEELSGSWATGERDTFSFSPQAFPEGSADTLIAGARDPNGMPDPDPDDNQERRFIERRADGVTVRMELLTDCYGSETSWELLDEDGDTLYSKRMNSYPGNANDPVEGGYLAEKEFCLSEANCYSFELHDSYDDGLHGSQYQGCDTDGELELLDEDGGTLLRLGNPDFGSDTSLSFCTDSVLMPDSFPEPSFSVFPNPTNGPFEFEVSGTPGRYTLRGYDLRGRSLLHTEFRMRGVSYQGRVELPALSSGIYILELDGPGSMIRKKLMVEQ